MDTWRPRVEHAQVFQPSDLQRIGRLGGWFASLRLCDRATTKPCGWVMIVIASVQPAQAYVPFARSPRGIASTPVTVQNIRYELR